MGIALTFTYQWKRCDVNGENCVDIAGAINQIYHPVTDDVASRLRVLVTATNSVGSSSALSSISAIITDNKANETDIARVFAHRKRVQVGKALEADTTRSLSLVYLGRANETDVANIVSNIVVGLIDQATETNTANPFTKFINIGEAFEIDTSTQLISVMGAASETDTANEIRVATIVDIIQISETNVSNTINYYKQIIIGQASETDQARALEGQGSNELTAQIGTYNSRAGKIEIGNY